MTNGSITISRPRPGTTARIEIRDESICANVLMAKISLENLAAALLGLADVPCTFSMSLSSQTQEKRTDSTRFVNGCTCRPVWITSERYIVAGEADCPIHGYGNSE